MYEELCFIGVHHGDLNYHNVLRVCDESVEGPLSLRRRYKYRFIEFESAQLWDTSVNEILIDSQGELDGIPNELGI